MANQHSNQHSGSQHSNQQSGNQHSGSQHSGTQSSGSQKTSQGSQQNITLVKKLFEELFSKGNISFADQVFSHDVKFNDTAISNFKGGLATLKEKGNLYKKAFQNLTYKIDEIFGTDDKVVVHWTAQATHKGELQDIPASGKNFKITGISIYTFSNGKITNVTQSWDRLGLLEQIGAVEASHALHR